MFSFIGWIIALDVLVFLFPRVTLSTRYKESLTVFAQMPLIRYQSLLEKSEKYDILLQVACAKVAFGQGWSFLPFLAWDKQKSTF